MQGDKGLQGDNGLPGPTGPNGLDGDRFACKTQNPTTIRPNKNSIIILSVETGLAYISGNSVIVAEVAKSLDGELNTFEGTIQYYNKASGQLIIKDIVNIHGDFDKEEPSYYHVNLDGVDGAPGEPGAQGPTGPSGELGPTGPTNFSDTLVSLNLIDNTLIIPKQTFPISYYYIKFNNGDELRNVKSNLKNNEIAHILIELCDLSSNVISSATIYTMFDETKIINYSHDIVLNHDKPFVMLKIYNINNLNLIECVSFYKNNYICL